MVEMSVKTRVQFFEEMSKKAKKPMIIDSSTNENANSTNNKENALTSVRFKIRKSAPPRTKFALHPLRDTNLTVQNQSNSKSRVDDNKQLQGIIDAVRPAIIHSSTAANSKRDDQPKKTQEVFQREDFSATSAPSTPKTETQRERCSRQPSWMLSPLQGQRPQVPKFKKKKRPSIVWRRSWQILYVTFAIAELLVSIQHKVSFVEFIREYFGNTRARVLQKNIGIAMKIFDSSLLALSLFLAETPGGNDLVAFLSNKTWEEMINTAFIVALCIQTMIASWSFVSQQKTDEEKQTKSRSTMVTGRSKPRAAVLESTSVNRHWIMQLTGNRVRWSRVTTEIFRGAVVVLLIRLLFIPFLRENPFLHVPFLGKQLKKKIKKATIGDPSAGSVDKVVSIAECLVAVFHTAAMLRLRKKIRGLVRSTIGFFIRRPWQASVRLKQIRRTIRWAKFIAPLIGTSNKLRGQYKEFCKARAQRLEKIRRRKAAASWSRIAQSINDKTRFERLVRTVQRRFRARRVESQQAWEAEQPKNSTRNPSPRTLRRLKRKKVQTNPRHKLLLMPNTSFSVFWRRTTVLCVIVEITQLLLARKFERTGKVPVEDVVQFILAPKDEKLIASISWMQVWATGVTWFSFRLAEFVSWVAFLDVFVTFFTGELKDNNLVPKPFVARWILPGVALQLIVNPTMKDVASLVKCTIHFARDVGPVKVFHVLVALLPLFHALVDWFASFLCRFVALQNKLAIGKKYKHRGY